MLNGYWKHAQVDRVWAGLRPYRRPVRVEMEQMVFDNGKSLKVRHTPTKLCHCLSLNNVNVINVETVSLFNRKL